jgi:hypothetical protein
MAFINLDLGSSANSRERTDSANAWLGEGAPRRRRNGRDPRRLGHSRTEPRPATFSTRAATTAESAREPSSRRSRTLARWDIRARYSDTRAGAGSGIRRTAIEHSSGWEATTDWSFGVASRARRSRPLADASIGPIGITLRIVGVVVMRQSALRAIAGYARPPRAPRLSYVAGPSVARSQTLSGTLPRPVR